MTPPEPVLFREEQRFRQTWVWVLIAVSSVPPAVVALLLLTVWDEPVGGLVVLALVVGVPFFFSRLTLTTEVRPDGLHLRFPPLVRHRHLRPEEISEATARTYRPLAEYGGWGIRWGRAGTAYNVSGDRGVQLVLADGKRLLVGSQRADELAAALATLRRR